MITICSSRSHALLCPVPGLWHCRRYSGAWSLFLCVGPPGHFVIPAGTIQSDPFVPANPRQAAFGLARWVALSTGSVFPVPVYRIFPYTLG